MAERGDEPPKPFRVYTLCGRALKPSTLRNKVVRRIEIDIRHHYTPEHLHRSASVTVSGSSVLLLRP
jgi:hypothetical protein